MVLIPELPNCLDLTNLGPTSRRLAKQSAPLSLELGKAGVGFLPGWSLLPSTAAPTRVTPVTFKSGICRCAFWKGVFNIITCISILTRVSLYFTPQHTVYYQFEFWNMYNCDFDIHLIFWQLGQGNSKHHRCFAELVSHFQFWLVWDIWFLLLLVSDIWELAANECLILTPRNSHLSYPMQLHLT